MPVSGRLPLWKRAAFSLATTTVVFALLTGGLVLAEDRGWISTFRQDDTMLYVTGTFLKPDKRGRQYQIMDAQRPDVVRASFPARKREGVFRVFVVGESFVLGNHHIPAEVPAPGYGTIADWVRELLTRRYPSVRFEVVNAGGSGVNSFRIRTVVEELLHAEPDLLILTLGNNEGYAPVAGVSEELHQWILYRLLKKAMIPEPARADRPAWTLQTLSATDIQRTFRDNVAQMVAAAQAAKVPVELATLPINLTGLSQRVESGERTSWKAEPACAETARHLAGGACTAALESAPACGHTFLVTLEAAECLRAAGQFDDARTLYEIAVQIDPRGRTRPSQNEALRVLSRQQGLPLADVEAAFVAAHPQHLPGDRAFIDAVHLTCMGYLRVARVMVDTLVEAGLVPGAAGEPLPSPTTPDLLEEVRWDPTDLPMPMDDRARHYAEQVCAPDAALE